MSNCKNCGKALSKTENRFCNQSCSASFNNRGIRRHWKEKALCACGCGRPVKRHESRFASSKCKRHYDYSEYIKRWKAGQESGVVYLGLVSNHIKRYLRDKFYDKCTKCGWAVIHPVTGVVPLQVNHVNGNCEDNREENLDLLCPNCHVLTHNYGALNIGNGRILKGLV
jgi:hypothetical protein